MTAPETDVSPPEEGSVLRFRRFGWRVHALALVVFAVLGWAMYGSYLNNTFQYDDEPNITKNLEYLRMERYVAAFSRSPDPDERLIREVLHPQFRPDSKDFTVAGILRGLWFATTHSPAKNRPVTNFTFALHIYFNEFHIDETYVPADVREEVEETLRAKYGDEEWRERLDEALEPHRVNPVVSFRVWNTVIHIFAGFAVYLLILRLLQLPALRDRFSRHLWPLAMVISLVWFCSPVQTQPVIYIVQRAVALSGLFYALALVCYLEFRAVEGGGLEWLGKCLYGTLPKGVFFRKTGFLLLGGLCAILSVFSKEVGGTVPLAALVIEYCLISKRDLKTSLTRSAVPGGVLVLALMLGAFHFYGARKVASRSGPSMSALGERKHSFEAFGESFYTDLFLKVLRDEVRGKIKISSRQRLLTEARVVAMYQSLILFPAPWRLNLDYDFLESTSFWDSREVLFRPLLLVLLLGGAAAAAPGVWRIPALLTAFWIAHWIGLTDVWWTPWPVPAVVWHIALMGVAAWYADRAPLVAFGVAWFYLGHIIESTVLGLEIVYEHRLYMPSLGLYVVVVAAFYRLFLHLSERMRPATDAGEENAEDGEACTANEA